MPIRVLTLATLPLLLACLVATPALAQGSGPESWVAQREGGDRFLNRSARPATGGARLGADRAAAAARSATGGKVLGVYPGEGDLFHVKLLYLDGRVRMVRVDGRTGAVLD